VDYKRLTFHTNLPFQLTDVIGFT